MNDLEQTSKEVIIESPFITSERMRTLSPIFEKLIKRDVKIYVFTRDPKEHDENLGAQSERAIQWCEEIGVQVLLCLGNHHRKLAIIDRNVLWEGSLNILSQVHSREFMRRLEGGGFAVDLFNFIGYERFL